MPSVLRRYTPPTCTLDVIARESPLSRWTDRTVVKRLQFRLQFDDPRLPPEEQIVVEGDRTVLEALGTVVDDYVRAQLVDSPRVPQMEGVTLGQAAIAPPDVSPSPSHRSEQDSSLGIQLHSEGALSHRLTLGAIAPDANHTSVRLSTLQLFDLATALDECTSEIMALSSAPSSSWLQPSSGWLRAAAVMVLALGTTLSVVRFVDPTLQTASSPETSTASSEDQQYSGVAVLPEAAESELNAPRIDPDALESIPPPPTPEESPSPRDRTPRVTVPSHAPIPPIAAEEPSPAATPVPPADLPPAVTLPSPTLESSPDDSQPSDESEAVSRARLNEAPQTESFTTAQESAESQATADAASDEPDLSESESVFDAIPQVAEVRTYFEQRWQPPEGLSSDLQYSILLNTDGSIYRVEPLGQASATYLDRTDIPLAGEPFVSATGANLNPRIRLVLKSDGEVQTFLESR